MYYGIDISHWNGNVDFSKIGKAFVIAKLSQAQGKDSKFDTYYTACNVPIGAYIYNKVKSIEDAKKEANFAVNALNGRRLPMGIWLDMEDSSMRRLGKAMLTEIINTEAGILRAAGYKVGIYCNKDWYSNVLDSATLAQSFPFWIARYPASDNGTIKESLNPSGLAGCVIWQYSSKGKVNGISGNTDLNVAFVEPTEIFTQAKEPVAQKPRTLIIGTLGKEVEELQRFLIEQGFNPGKVDGIYGVKTADAVRKYQADWNNRHPENKLAVDGKWGPLTQATVGK